MFYSGSLLENCCRLMLSVAFVLACSAKANIHKARQTDSSYYKYVTMIETNNKQLHKQI